MRLTGFSVLVVEDDEDNRDLLSAHLEDEGAIVIAAASISSALSMTLKCDVDALLCDLELPDGDACKLLGELKKRDGWQNLPAIVLTGYSDERRRNHAKECGFHRYAVKPFSLEELTEWLGELIDLQSVRLGQACPAVADRAARGQRDQ